MSKRKVRLDVLCYIVLILGSLFVILPILYMISTSFKSISEIQTAKVPTLFPKSFSLEGYKNIVGNYPFATYLKNSLLLTCLSTLISVAFSTLAGYGFSRFKFRGKGAAMFFILTTQMFPTVMLYVPYYKLLTMYRLNNTYAGLTLVFIASVIPFCSWMMYGYFNGISRELDEAAFIDGCGRFRTFFQIIAPLTLPGVISTTIYAFIYNWYEYMFTMLFTAADEMKA